MPELKDTEDISVASVTSQHKIRDVRVSTSTMDTRVLCSAIAVP
jgi:hypothetical protein